MPTRITDTTATIIDNIWTNNVTSRIESGLVTVRVSDHLPVFAFIGGNEEERGVNGKTDMRRLINARRIAEFGEVL